ncbi:MAG TPA: hypothetical protein VN721_17185 [Flavipsychrobacter sp.]|nr:hypothetical protein [Flavipsychrobacter sp.]
MTKKRIIWLIVIIIILLPLWMVVWWCLTPKKKLVVAIIDKTVLTPDGQEHVSLTWILNHEKFTKNKTELYKVSRDYFGFFPFANEKYRIKGLERFSNDQLNQLSNDADLVYITDAYGVYRNEWLSQKNNTERSGMIYGGLSEQDINFLSDIKAKHKLILTEFNSIGSPTSDDIRDKFEQLFSLHWTGWTGRFFESLDTNINTELPRWLINDYKRENGGKWPFTKEGIAFVNNKDQVVVLEKDTHLTQPIPKIITSEAAARAYNLPEQINYPFWFDVLTTDTSVNKILSHFQIDFNNAGKAELVKYGIPLTFPAVQMHIGDDYQFAYFSADFSDNPLDISSSYFKGAEYFKFLFYNHLDHIDRRKFFWFYYRPLITKILDDYYDKIKKHHLGR